MATRKHTDEHFVKALNPRDADTKYMGEEPFFPVQPDTEERFSALARSFTWYTRFYSKKDAKELLCQYLDYNKRTDDAKQVRKVHESEFIITLCWVARMTMRGLELTEQEELTLQNEIKRLVKSLTETEVKTSATSIAKEETVTARPNIQEILKEKARDAAGDMEGMIDDFITKGKAVEKTVDIVAKYNVMPQHIHIIVDIWKRKQDEFQKLSDGDESLKEGYSFLGKIQIRNILKFIDGVLSDLNSYISIKKASKAPRKKKAVPIEKIVAKLKYLKTFKDVASKLDLVSVHPTKLHGASECYLYDTSKRKLIYMCADDYSKTFTVKGTTILGFDTNKSQIKTLRKPGESLPALMKLGKPAGRKFFDEIKAVGTTPNGRTNENMIILKAW
jgi:ElaB/YqjD/DUF883 family membrane-anchored ribosome-binding protein